MSLRRILKAVNNYLVFFLVVAFVVTCCMMLFVRTMANTMGLVLDSENVAVAAKLTFGNVVLITLIFATIDRIRRKITVERPLESITQAAEQLMQGDFTVRIKPQSRFGSDDSFNRIIACFNQLARELGSVETLRTDFVANVSHEMKTPLAVMQNYGVLLQNPELSREERIEYGKSISESARGMADMMTNILKLNRLENQQIFPMNSTFDLGEQLCRCLLQYESVWEREEIEIETDIQEDVTVQGDEELLSLVWSNLFSNAFKFTPAGGKVSLRLWADDTYALVRVEDTGCGMSPEVGAHIFEKFYQGDTSRATRGNGLGLALVKRVMDIVRGEIHVESEVGRGTAFTVKLRRN